MKNKANLATAQYAGDKGQGRQIMRYKFKLSQKVWCTQQAQQREEEAQFTLT